MKYILKWTDSNTGAARKITVHSMHAVQEVKDTLNRQPWRHENLTVTEVRPTRFNDIIIKLEER